MAVGTWTPKSTRSFSEKSGTAEFSIGSVFWTFLRTLGSLKITVAMFALGMLILFVGTLAQDEESLVDVKSHYFNSWIAVVPLDVFMPLTIWPHQNPLPFSIPIPGGASVGLILLINLIAAKLSRFSMTARGGRFATGLLFSIVGFALIAVVISTAHYSDGLQGEPPFSYDLLWLACKASVWFFAIASIVMPTIWTPKTHLVRFVAITIAVIFASLSIFLLLSNDAYRIPDPGLRILWQFAKSMFVSIILLLGMVILFGKRGGNVVIHLGVGLLMLGQFIFGDRQVEERFTLQESQTTSMAYRIDEVELAIIDKSDSSVDRVAAIDQHALQRSARNGSTIDLENPPLKVKVIQWMQNSQDVKIDEIGKNPATAGLGLRFAFKESPKAGGLSDESNLASAYVQITDKNSDRELGTYLVSQLLNDSQLRPMSIPETIQVDGKTYDLELRFRRNYKPYQITLNDVSRRDYSGTSTPRDYSSIVTVEDKRDGQKQDGHIWMNNPMRYEGETFYQSGYSPPTKLIPVETTTLQVVKNAGWLIPYVACVLTGLGLLVHFSGTFFRFALRFERQMHSPSTTSGTNELEIPGYEIAARKARQGVLGWLVPVVVASILGLIMLSSALPPSTSKSTFNWYAAGQIPTQYSGQLRSLDSVARNILQILSNKTQGYNAEGKKIPAAQWLIAVMADEDWVERSPVIRIDAKEVLDRFGLDRAPEERRNRYSFKQLEPKLQKIRQELAYLEKKPDKEWDFAETKLSETLKKIGLFQSILYSYRPSIPDFTGDTKDAAAMENLRTQIVQLMQQYEMLEGTNPPGILPPAADEERDAKDNRERRWQAYGPALFTAYAGKLFGMDIDKTHILAFTEVIDGIKSNDARKFNRAVEDYRALLAKSSETKGKSDRIAFEAWYHRLNPMANSIALYIVAGVLCLSSFLFARQILRRSAFWICLLVLLLHTYAIISRIYISERPPVINLYSAAVFIGWASVLICVVAEALFPVGIASIVGATCGTLSLLVAYIGLDNGDTMPVLQAVLDTQFWLSTHVITVTLGYSATFVAGTFAIALMLHRIFCRYDATPIEQRSKDNVSIQRMLFLITYGIVCFAMFLSFVGTVLGGLWADDSWGRFWGWDPKENGALMIVLWNALLLHARWDKIVQERGFALLAIVGNIVTSWSMFGTNQLGIGLHAYGGATLSAMLLLGLFVFAHLLFIGFGWALTRRPVAVT